MSELSIRIKIADREYPMRVNEDEEERLRQAGKYLNERLRMFREEFGIHDKQDLLAMIALETAADKIKTEDAAVETQLSLEEKLSSLNQLLSSLQLG
ncbi:MULTISPECIES: cell division protein ZapA [Rufibacter]|jgi:cell division protein ZapA|uniref:Cell division protein ZapA n=3 Tax=Rufibacter TaxID=1379908 RepID=A0A0P0CVH5_9BACT|nr:MULTISPECIES: cell division protein ZapA [Rufibacter]ALI98443.1 cell division protein ZapA [Rufibacter tibetensis]MBC3538895.1 cell division protein ZapA [Rufibacter sediminis]RNI31556.1 cell division protein ZapA [Rufibacter latericius]